MGEEEEEEEEEPEPEPEPEPGDENLSKPRPSEHGFIKMDEQQKWERGAELDQSHFCCSICLDLLKEPVTILCGHSYCKNCIEGCWDQNEEKGTYSCPQCRETFSPRPVVRRNNMLAQVVEMLKRTGDQNASPPADLACAGPEDVACDFCCGTKRNKATVSCLTCLASYCPVHLKPHCSFNVLKTHQLVSATVPLQEKLCTKHNKLKEVYCQKDQMCICYLCTLDEHRGHSALSAAAERAKEQSCSRSAVESCDETIDELISFIKTKHTLVTQLIKSREETAVAQAEALQLQLEEEIARLHRRDTYLDQLSHTDDHIHFIQSFQSLSTSCESTDLPPGAVVRPQHSFKTVIGYMSLLRGDVESLLEQTWARISAAVSTIDVVLPPMPKTREDLLRYCCPLTLDASSVSKSLSLSEDYQRVTSKEYLNNYGRVMGKNYSSYHDAPSDRFTGIRQVLCTEGLSERRYWEVTWVGHTWSVAVTYKDIGSTSSYNSEFGQNDMSWSLECSPDGYTFRHNRSIKAVSGPESCRVGVYLDYLAGTLSFYSVSDTVTLLHTESTTFTQPLYPGLGLKNTDSQSSSGFYAELVKLW